MLVRDFGFRVHAHADNSAAPEVLEMKGYDEACDLWGVGVITYIL
jgi:hypothetical protein